VSALGDEIGENFRHFPVVVCDEHSHGGTNEIRPRAAASER
jgi:hypothetical protein